MKNKIILSIILSLCATSIVAQTISGNAMEQSFFLKIRNKSSVNKAAVTTMFLSGDSAGDECRNENNYRACEKFENTVSQLISICHQYNYQQACDNATHLVSHDLTIRAIKAS